MIHDLDDLSCPPKIWYSCSFILFDIFSAFSDPVGSLVSTLLVVGCWLVRPAYNFLRMAQCEYDV